MNQLRAAINTTRNPPAGSQTQEEALREQTTDVQGEAKRPKPSQPDPERFTGEDESVYPQFKGLLDAKLHIDGRAIGTEEECVWYAFGRLGTKAQGRIFPWMNYTKDTDQFTVREFMKQLDAAFSDPQKQNKALARINSIRQGNKDFREFLRDFEQTLLEA